MTISAVSCDVGADRSVFDMKISTGSHTKHVINTTAVFSCKNFGRDANKTFFSTKLACFILGHSFIMIMINYTKFYFIRLANDYDSFSVEVDCEQQLDLLGIPTPTFQSVTWPTCKEGELKKISFIKIIRMLQCPTFQKPLVHQFRIHRKTWPIEDTRSKAQVCKMFKMSKVCKPSNAIGHLVWETSSKFV